MTRAVPIKSSFTYDAIKVTASLSNEVAWQVGEAPPTTFPEEVSRGAKTLEPRGVSTLVLPARLQREAQHSTGIPVAACSPHHHRHSTPLLAVS
jgi:hypothetical protein